MKAYYAGREDEMPYKTLAAFRTARRRSEQSPAFKAWRNRNIDAKTLKRWGNIKEFRSCPKTLETLQKIKYNKPTEWEALKRERKTIEEINGKNWTDTFYKQAIETYYRFREKGIEFTDHGVARFLSRITEKDFMEIHAKPYNYIQADGRLVKYYNNTVIIYNEKTKEVISIVNDRKQPRGDWNEFKNKDNI